MAIQDYQTTHLPPSPPLISLIPLLSLPNNNIITNELMYELNYVDKENNANHMNLTFRRRKKLSKPEGKPVPTILEATFNPLPKINHVAGSLHQRRQSKTIEIPQDLFEGLQPHMQSKHNLKQGPAIVKSTKLKSFFGCESDRYGERRRFSVNQIYQGGSLQTIRERKPQKMRQISKTIETNGQLSKKEEFIRLYNKQKREYDLLLLKYGIHQSVEDKEYYQYLQE